MTRLVRTAGRRTFASLRRHRNYRLYFAGQITSVCGTWMQNVALYWLILSLTHSPLAVGLLYECRHDENGGKSLAILALGMAIELFGLALAAQSSSVGCVLVFLIPVCAFVLACLEGLLRKLLAPRKHRPSSGAARR